MVALFGSVMAFVIAALTIGFRRFWKDQRSGAGPHEQLSTLRALRDAMTLTHLHGNGADCSSGEEVRTPLRRWCHHLTLYGFALCVASTSVAGFYHSVLGRIAPYPYTSAPVVLGTLGGAALLIGPAGLFVLQRRRDAALSDPAQAGLDISFIALLWLSTVTGMVLLVTRSTGAMPPLLMVHLGLVLALFVTLPYGKFVHGIYRTAALVKYARETTSAARDEEMAAPDPTSPYEAPAASGQIDAVVGVRD
jgi:citrate/tricarballylate utilization protein